MKLSDYRQTYYEFSGKLSDVARHLAFAGIALVWLFRIQEDHVPKIPKELILPAITLALTLAFDLLHYLSGSVVWGIFQWYQERQLTDLSENPDLDSSSILKWPQFTFFVLKIVTVTLSYCLLVSYLSTSWLKSGE